MQNVYAAPLYRVFKQAPWRTQTQILAALSIGLLILLVVGGLYLAVASRAGNAGRDLQNLETRKAELLRENDRMRAQLADLRSMNRMAARALELGFAPANPQQLLYVQVPDYPHPVTPNVTPATAVASNASSDWLTTTLQQLLGGG
ncbi:MAG: hypothetical protein ACT4QE_25830 [Anaerolineales bacterium]